MTSFTKVAERNKLKPRRDPYWARISQGCYLGYRKMSADSAGHWSARFKDETQNKQVYTSFGDLLDVPDANRYDAAYTAAQGWFQHLGKGGTPGAFTVADACAKYAGHIRSTKTEKAAADAKARFDAYVLCDIRFANTELTKLQPAHIAAWRERLKNRPITSGKNRGELRTASTLNRDMTPFRAALNLAYKDGLTTTDFAWKNKLLPIPNADRSRELYLDLPQRRKLIDHANDDLGKFCQGLSLLPLRPGAAAALTVKLFEPRLHTLKIKFDKNKPPREVELPPETALFFAAMCKDKFPNALIFSRADGSAWNKDNWKYPIREAVTAAGLPAEATCYCIRHGVITDLIHQGLDILTVAQLSGTSVRMIEKHYGHLKRNHATKALAMLAL